MNVIGSIIIAIFIVGFAVPALILGSVFIFEILKDCKPLLFILLTFPVFPLIFLIWSIADYFKEKRGEKNDS